MTRVSVALLGVTMISCLWFGVLLTVFTPQHPAGGFSHALSRWILSSRIVTGRLPPRLATLVCQMRAGLILASVVTLWLVLDLLGFLLIAGSLELMPEGVISFLAGRGEGSLLVLLTWASFGVLFAAVVAYLVRFAAAYRNREMLLLRLSCENVGAPDAEVMLAQLLRGQSQDDLVRAFAEWENWLVEVDYNHSHHPALLLMPATSAISWEEAAVMMLDTAALVGAAAPQWAPRTRKAS